eukprot:gnl/MRDRNA2_/MRDRNA2_135376_c0_seq1.p1 gnl/MRDRNA2_/MRDRNA2_135376_c0~~gnl/MRDRNA2_/MRDRNA2_135376_c0_seq1.p1  ORF type:complete len:498 (+),score=81.35 gnl/MRDRNA2_/MRDRNA2_135376_c0_seq1:137-1630(+)
MMMVPTPAIIEIPFLLAPSFAFSRCRVICRHWREYITGALQNLLSLRWHIKDPDGMTMEEEEEMLWSEVDRELCKSSVRFQSMHGRLIGSVITTGPSLQHAGRILTQALNAIGFTGPRGKQDLHLGLLTGAHMERLAWLLLSPQNSKSVSNLFPQGNQLRTLVFYKQTQFDGMSKWLPVIASGLRACTQLQHLVWWTAGGCEMPTDLEKCLVESTAVLDHLESFSFGHGFLNWYDGQVYKAFEGHKSLQVLELLTEYGDPDMLMNALSFVNSLLKIPKLRRVHCLVLGTYASAATGTVGILHKILALASKVASFGGLPVPGIYSMMHPMRVISPWDRRIDPLSTILTNLTEVAIMFDLALADDPADLEATLLPLPKFMPSLRILRLVFSDTPSMFGTNWKGESWDMTLIRCLATAEPTVVPFRLEELHVHACYNSCAASQRMDLVQRVHAACPHLRHVVVSHEVVREEEALDCGDSLIARLQIREKFQPDCFCELSL